MPIIQPINPIRPPRPTPVIDPVVTAVEAAVSASCAVTGRNSDNIASAVNDLIFQCKQYQQMLREQSPDNGKIQLAQLQRTNPDAYNRVFATLDVDSQAIMTDFSNQYSGQPLPDVVVIQPMSNVIAVGPIGPTPPIVIRGKKK